MLIYGVCTDAFEFYWLVVFYHVIYDNVLLNVNLLATLNSRKAGIMSIMAVAGGTPFQGGVLWG